MSSIFQYHLIVTLCMLYHIVPNFLFNLYVISCALLCSPCHVVRFSSVQCNTYGMLTPFYLSPNMGLQINPHHVFPTLLLFRKLAFNSQIRDSYNARILRNILPFSIPLLQMINRRKIFHFHFLIVSAWEITRATDGGTNDW